jgi:hypothetical protein
VVAGDGSLEVFAQAPWGGPDGVNEVLEDYPSFGEMSSEQMRMVRVPPRIRLGADGRLHALAEAPGTVHHFDAHGRLAGRTSIPRDDPASRISDFVVGPDDSVYLLERIASDDRMRKVGSTGDVAWSRIGPITEDRLGARFNRLLFDENFRLFATAPGEWGVLAEIDPASGRTVRVLASGVDSDEVFMDSAGRLQSIVYLPTTRQRGLATFELASGRAQTIPFDDDAYGWLTWPLGVDAWSNVYGWKDGEIARVAPDGGVQIVAAFDGAAVSPDGSVHTSHRDWPLALRVEGHRTGPTTLLVPEGPHWRLIHVDGQGRLYVFGGEAPGSRGTLLVYSRDGQLEQTQTPPPDLLPLESRLDSPRNWRVGQDGRIYIPLTDGEGFKVLRLRPASADAAP